MGCLTAEAALILLHPEWQDWDLRLQLAGGFGKHVYKPPASFPGALQFMLYHVSCLDSTQHGKLGEGRR